jgi:cell division protein FtsW (lipid II flippase)
MSKRVGNFFLLLGTLLLVVFFASPTKSAFYFRFCFGGVFFMFVGIFFHSIARDKRPQSKRFRLLREMFSDQEEESPDEKS